MLTPGLLTGTMPVMPDRATQVWNRAALDRAGAVGPGDRALAALIHFHGQAMSGGVLNAIESVTVEEFVSVVDGLRYFGLAAAADVLEDVRSRIASGLDDDEADQLEGEADNRYAAVIDRDQVIVAAFERRSSQDPQDFAPTM